MKIILGSQSKGRKKMLEEMGYEFDVMSADIDEKAIRLEDPKELTSAIARAKAEALKLKIFEPAILITADTVVVCNGYILEKPEDEEQAKEFLKKYTDFPAEVITAIVVTNIKTCKQKCDTYRAIVHFAPFSEKEINDLIQKGDVFRLAGAFDVEGPIWDIHLKKIDGTRDGAFGLPKELTKRLIFDVMY